MRKKSSIIKWVQRACKFAQQTYFDFYNPSEYKPLPPSLEQQEDNFWKFVQEEANPEEVGSIDALENVLLRHSEQTKVFLETYANIYHPRVVTFETGAQVITLDLGELYVIDGYNVKEAKEWVSTLYDHELSHYVHEKDFNKEFWESVGKMDVLYHATDSENVPSIMKSGLQPSSETRGISNRGMGPAVFTSPNHEEIDAYGDTIIEINVGAMKAAGYMPEVSGEEPLSEEEMKSSIAWELGIEDYEGASYASEGLSEDTVAFYGGIPAKFLRVGNSN